MKENLEDLLNKKVEQKPSEEKTDEITPNETSTTKEDLKARMRKVINASKKLDNDLLNEDPKKALLREKLANASKKVETEEDEEENEEVISEKEEIKEIDAKETSADFFTTKNNKLKGRLSELNKRLEEMIAYESIEKDIEEPNLEEINDNKNIENNSVDNIEEPKLDDNNIEPIVENNEVTEPERESDVVLGGKIVQDIVNEHKSQVEVAPTTENTFSDETKDLNNTIIPPLEEKKVSTNSVWKQILDFIIKSMNGMAYGLFATLIMGTIISTVGGLFTEGTLINKLLLILGDNVLKNLTGFGIGIGIAWSLGYKDLKLIALGISGAITAMFCYQGSTPAFSFWADSETYSFIGLKVGDPLTIYLVVVITALILNQIFRKKTPVDIIIVPLFICLLATSLTLLTSEYIVYVTTGIGKFIGIATEYQPILMGVIIAVVMGMALTAPISSAAIAATIFTTSAYASNEYVAIAGGAALIGCCTQMVGFAIMSRKDNNIGTVIAIGIGTSMLQFKNILKKPIIWLPTILASAILGPIATTLIDLKCLGTAAGMGTSGLVGQIGSFASMGSDWANWQTWAILIGFEVIAPLILVLIFDIIFRKLKWIKKGDLTV